MKRVLILEDNHTVAEHLKKLIQELEVKCEVYATHDLKEAYLYSLENMVDLFVVDIILDASRPGDTSGLKFVDHLRQIERYVFVPVIFVTSLEDARLYTYEKLHCYSFIEKPFDEKVVKKTIEKCLQFPGKEHEKKTLYFRKDGIIFAVEVDELVYAECINHVLYMHINNGDVLEVPYITLKQLLHETTGYTFVQCSRNTVLNKDFVDNVDIPNRIIRLKNHHGKVEIGIRYKQQIKESFYLQNKL